MDLSTPISKLPRVGPILIGKLKKLQINTVGDLLYHIPFRYENIGATKKIGSVGVGETVSIAGKVIESRNIRTRYGKFLTKAVINDGTASIEAVWFNQPFLTKIIKAGSAISLAGKVGVFSHRPTLVNPEYEIVGSEPKKTIHTEGLVPVYPETAGISSKWIRNKIREVISLTLPKMRETLPEPVLKRNNLIPLTQAIWKAHYPKNLKEAQSSRKRLAFDELLITQLRSLERKKLWNEKRKGIKLPTYQERIIQLISQLPFSLTDSQKRVLKDILGDFGSQKPMNRLLQGDVGTGKTIVSAIAAYVVHLNGYQSAFMAPTEILAIQHFKTIKEILEPLGVRVAIRTGSKKMTDENFNIIIGTHALLSKNIEFKKLAFVVIDEQHRFGVEQRAVLRNLGKTPHVLTMTATPIPRSLALTLYGDLDVSLIEEPLPDRKPVKTFLVPPKKRAKAYEFIRGQTKKGSQVFIIFPLIDPSETLESVKAATQEYDRLKKDIFPDLSIGLLHGRLKPREKEKIIGQFANKEYDILVSTPVVEVGIDIQNATIMMIEGAERFGLASLHQLRGRVGRGLQQSFCLLFTESSSPTVLERLSALEKHNVGLKLAEIDLKMRGPGQIHGTLQSGIHEFKVASLADLDLISATKSEVGEIFTQIKSGKLENLAKLISSDSLISPD